MSSALESSERGHKRQLPLGSITPNLDQHPWVTIVQGQNENQQSFKKPELHLIPYRVDIHTYQIGMNGVVTSKLTAVNFSEQATQTKVTVTSHRNEISSEQLELPGFDFNRWDTLQKYYKSSAVAEWVLFLKLKHTGELLKAENIAQLPATVAKELFLGRTLALHSAS